MSILTFGSVNIDHVHRLARHPAPGETLADEHYARGLGGKGANQSLAACRAGAAVAHAGAVGADGAWCREALSGAGIDCRDLVEVDAATGHAVILVDRTGENVIVIHGGANRAIPDDLAARAIARRRAGDWFLVQNETNGTAEAARLARQAGLRVAYAAAPFDPVSAAGMLDLVDLIAVNEIEAAQLDAAVGASAGPARLVTRGARGAVFNGPGGEIQVPAFAVEPVDTTGAGDTYLGFFLAGLDAGQSHAEAMRRAAAAAALQVTRAGAAEAIPTDPEVGAFLAARSR